MLNIIRDLLESEHTRNGEKKRGISTRTHTNMNRFFPEYPKLFQESDIVCRHPFNSSWGLPTAKSELCKICRDFLVSQAKLYEKLSTP